MVADLTYANYLRLAGMCLILPHEQLMSLDWQWMDAGARDDAIQRLMNLAAVRDQPETSGTREAAW